MRPYEDAKKYIAHEDQLLTVREFMLCGGKKEGTRAIEVFNGCGLSFVVLADRCLDFAEVRLNGRLLNFITPAGIVNSKYYQKSGLSWLDSFGAGFLTTCGLDNIGNPGDFEGSELGLHGRIGNTPAEEVSVERYLDHGVPAVKIRGKMREAVLFGMNLSLTRTIICKYGINDIYFKDEIENHGAKTEPYMSLYHFNMGYPLLTEDAVIKLHTQKVTPRDSHAGAYTDRWNEIFHPQADFREMCYYHDVVPEADGTGKVTLENKAENLSMTLIYSRKTLDNFVQWKFMGERSFVMGLEPCNSTLEGKADAKEKGNLKTLAPDETVAHEFTIQVR